LPMVILSWVSWGRWASHLPAIATVSGQVESECGRPWQARPIVFRLGWDGKKENVYPP
jgi:hypothetical protein